jgi:serine/threonine-protein kinase
MTMSTFIDHRYELGDLLGVGGTGVVHAATERHTGRELAIKVLLPELASDAPARARFVEEARVAQHVRHPNVVRVVDDGALADGRPYIVMERAPGESLGAWIRRHGPLSLALVRAIASQVLEGVAAIHGCGFIHGDLKSDNILVSVATGGVRATIIDFGLARPPATRPLFVADDMVSGTPDYVAPETLRGALATEAADVYAIGIVLYEMVTGTTPFGGGSPATVFDRHLADPIVPPSLRCPDRHIPRVFEGVIMRALAKRPARRHADAASLATAVVRSLRSVLDEAEAPREVAAFSYDGPTRDWLRPAS